MKRKILTFFIAFNCFSGVFAQMQIGQGLNDFYNIAPEIHNMALLPLTSVPSASLIAGSRLNGLHKHPVQASFLCNTYLIDHLGAGLRVNYERMGLLSQTDVQLGLIYYVFLNKEKTDGSNISGAGNKFSFFAAGHFTQDWLNRKNIVVNDPYDPNLYDIRTVAQNGNASAGIAFLQENKYYVGASVYQLLKSKSSFRNPEMHNNKKMHYYLTASYTFNIGKYHDYAIELHGIGVLRSFKVYQYEAGLDFKIKKICQFGMGYRSNGSLKFDAGFTTKSWDFGYLCSYGAWVDATAYSYKAVNNMIFVKRLINEGRKMKR